MPDLSSLTKDLGDIPVIVDRAKVQQRSRDFYWYSPVLKRQLEQVSRRPRGRRRATRRR